MSVHREIICSLLDTLQWLLRESCAELLATFDNIQIIIIAVNTELIGCNYWKLRSRSWPCIGELFALNWRISGDETCVYWMTTFDNIITVVIISFDIIISSSLIIMYLEFYRYCSNHFSSNKSSNTIISVITRMCTRVLPSHPLHSIYDIRPQSITSCHYEARRWWHIAGGGRRQKGKPLDCLPVGRSVDRLVGRSLNSRLRCWEKNIPDLIFHSFQ